MCLGVWKGVPSVLCYVLAVVIRASAAWSPAGCAAEAGTSSDFQETADLD